MLQEPGNAAQQSLEETTQGLKKLIVKRRWAGQDEDGLLHKLDDIAPEECLTVEAAETD